MRARSPLGVAPSVLVACCGEQADENRRDEALHISLLPAVLSVLSNRKCGRRTQNEYDSATPFVRGAITASPRGSAIVPWAFGFVVDFEKAA